MPISLNRSADREGTKGIVDRNVIDLHSIAVLVHVQLRSTPVI
jgi:hypothetical protein